MNAGKRDIIFLNRAYNDLDIQLSLIAAFAEDSRFNVRVIGYPCDGDVGSPQAHEAVRYMKEKHGVSFETVLDKAPAPLPLVIAYKISRILDGLRRRSFAKNAVIGLPLKGLHVGLLTLMRKKLRGDLPWLDKVTESWNPLFFVCDEVLGYTGRSYMMDKIMRQKAQEGIPVYVVKTGHDIYWDPVPNKSQAAQNMVQNVNYKKTPATRFIAPGQLDKNALLTLFPDENIEIHGNLRMDRSWIRTLHDKIFVPPYVDKPKHLQKLPEGKVKVVFMLSKLGYGIVLDELKATIRAVANMPGVACAIKPHTRGMKFDFMSKEEIGNIAIVDDVPSTVLIEWADVVLFTGSSIAFHTMLLNKRVGFLQYCQSLKTIFDDGQACDRFDSLEQFKTIIAAWRDNGVPVIGAEDQKRLHGWQAKHIHGGIEDGLTAAHYKAMILEDLGIKANKKAA